MRKSDPKKFMRPHKNCQFKMLLMMPANAEWILDGFLDVFWMDDFWMDFGSRDYSHISITVGTPCCLS
ncbi:unnamed protein product [Meloidogyne enterolobii]|uniref:Uncharacterized protein n=1 Tax=Meloidogyne enterolobii TaxID=390850 RepID=A0ACB0ZNJ7_MELEN